MRIGIDLGGTKIESIALDDQGVELHRERVPAPRDDYTETLRSITGLVDNIERRTGHRGSVGVGTPGSISPATGLMKNANSTQLIGRAFDDDLRVALGREVRLANDANCFALSEAIDGAGAGRRVVFGVIVGTGTGGGVVVNGEVLIGPNAIAGEWGHNPLPWPRSHERPGERCYCGKTGCVETFLSGPAFARDFRQAAGRALAPAEIARLAGRGDRWAVAALERYEDRMARALAQVINLLDPDLIILGGGMSNVERLYDNVPRLWGDYVFSDRVNTELVAPRHGDASGVRGAAWLWPPIPDATPGGKRS